MHVMTVHSGYQQPGGEDTVFETESRLLESAGQKVTQLRFSNSEIRADTLRTKVLSGLQSVWSFEAREKVKRAILKVRPDIVHFHNTFPLLSPSVYYACADAGVPCIQTLHNYRLLCANATFVRQGAVCELCINGQFINGVRYACYREGRASSAAVVAMQYTHRWLHTFTQKIDCFIALTEFARAKFVSGGIPADKLVVKSNSLAGDPGQGVGSGRYALYVGRLSSEKGLETLMRAWSYLPDVPLKIVGDGPLREFVSNSASALGSHVEVLGAVDRDSVFSLMGEARVLLVPSEWYEGFPMTVLEAYARGTPVIASRIGSLIEIVRDGQDGRHFTPGDAKELSIAVTSIFHDDYLLRKMRASARARYLESYSPEKSLATLLGVYRRVMSSPNGSLK
jgi:glycosyltransferase involved in cell wall biosynthesis